MRYFEWVMSILMCVLFIVGATFFSFHKFYSRVTIQGNIVSHNAVHVLTGLNSGMVEAVLRHNGDYVEAGETIVVIRSEASGDKIRISAPSNGEIFGMSIIVGDGLKENHPIGAIYDRSQHASVVAYIPTLLMSRVRKGANARVMLDLGNSRGADTLLGKVSTLFPASRGVSSEAPTSEINGFRVDIELDDEASGKARDGFQMYPGMPVSISILDAERTGFEWLAARYSSR